MPPGGDAFVQDDVPPPPSDSAPPAPSTELSIVRVVPNHGPFSGGNRVILRGSGFTEEAQVDFGGRRVQPADHRLIDRRRLEVVVPPGEVGSVDVTVRVASNSFTLRMGYTYDAIKVDPNSGSTTGGTFVTITGIGTNFQEGDRVIFGSSECRNVRVLSPVRITCRTPPSAPTTVDVKVVSAVDGSETVGVGAYTYYDTTDPFAGGLGGGPISGSVHLTVIDAMTGLPVADAFAMLGNDIATEHQGLTNEMGQITFSGPDLVGPQTIHVAKHCYQRTSFVAFDARDVTVFLLPWMDPRCGMGSPGGNRGRGRNGAFIEGELIWRGTAEFPPYPWSNIPQPQEGWERVAYVFTTQSSPSHPNPDPSIGGVHRVLEQPVPGARLGYPYRIFVRPAGLAVYAIAGLENPTEGRFIPYVMGVRRNVLVGPGETLREVDIEMNIPLDHGLELRLGRRPGRVARGPDRYRFQAFLDLGGEGVIVRQWGNYNFDTFRKAHVGSTVRLMPYPPLQGVLRDARFFITAGWYTSQFDQPPYTSVRVHDVVATDGIIDLPDFLGIPTSVSPVDGAPLPGDRVLRWELSAGGAEADFFVVFVVGGDGNPAWEHFVPGNVYEAPTPDLSSIPMLEDIAPGEIVWGVYAIRIPGFVFNEFSYRYLNERYWSHVASNTFTMLR